MTHPEFSEFDVTTCICSNLRLATRKATQMYDAFLRPAGITAAQFNIIATLKHRPDLPLSRLADILGVDRTTLSRNLQPLMRRGLIESGSENDTRVRTTRLSEAGLRKFDESYPLWQQAQAVLSRRLGTSAVTVLLSALNDVLSGIEQIET